MEKKKDLATFIGVVVGLLICLLLSMRVAVIDTTMLPDDNGNLYVKYVPRPGELLEMFKNTIYIKMDVTNAFIDARPYERGDPIRVTYVYSCWMEWLRNMKHGLEYDLMDTEMGLYADSYSKKAPLLCFVRYTGV